MEPAQVVEAIARALDSDDFASVRSLIARDCIYTIEGETKAGPDEIVASYQAGSDLAHLLFETVSYDHEIVPLDDGRTFRARFIDELTVAGDTLVHVTEQEIRVNTEGLVDQIIDLRVEGEEERLDAFLTEHGLSRPA